MKHVTIKRIEEWMDEQEKQQNKFKWQGHTIKVGFIRMTFLSNIKAR